MSASPSAGVLAIMAKAPRPGHVKTRLASAFGSDVIVELYRALVEDTLDLGRSVHGVDLAVICPSGDAEAVRAWLPPDVAVIAQRGHGLADGLRSTFEALCTFERRPVVAFNSDSPHVGADLLASTFRALAHHDLVVGPSNDGGYYLVGSTEAHRALFDPPAMGTSSARDALLFQARRLGLSVWITEEHYDIDLPEDVARARRELARHPERAPRTAAVLSRWHGGDGDA